MHLLPIPVISLKHPVIMGIAAAIPGAELKMYPQWGHGLYEEAKDFNGVLLEFLARE